MKIEELAYQPTNTKSRLSPTEIIKPVKGIGPRRYNVLLELIEKNLPVELIDGRFVKIDKEKSKEPIAVLETRDPEIIRNYFASLRGKKVFVEQETGDFFGLGDMKKSTVMGGGGLTGENRTKIQEEAHALGFVIASMLKRDLTIDDLTEENFRKGLANVRGSKEDFDIEKISTGLKYNKHWKQSIVNIVNSFRNNPQTKDFADYHWHRNSEFVKILHKKFYDLRKTIKVKQSSEIVLKHFAKWNPSDIWAVNPNLQIVDIQKDLNDIHSLAGLNEWMIEQYEKKNFLGVSLKIRQHKTIRPSITIENYQKDIDQKVLDIAKAITIDDIRVGDENNVLSTMGAEIRGTILNKRFVFTIRSFKRESSISGDFKIQSLPPQGKIGLVTLLDYIKHIGEEFGINVVVKAGNTTVSPDSIRTPREYYKITRYYGVEKLIDEIKDFLEYLRFYNHAKSIENNYQQYKERFENDLSRVISKHQSLSVLILILQLNKHIEEFFSEIYLYAAGKTPISSIYAGILVI